MDILCADIHVSEKSFDLVKQGFSSILRESKDSKSPYLYILGDFWDHKAYMKFGSLVFTWFLENVVPAFEHIWIMEGTPLHDYDGFDIFRPIPSITVVDKASVLRISGGKHALFLPQKSIVDGRMDLCGEVDHKEIDLKDLPKKLPVELEYVFGHFFVQGATYNGKSLPEDMISERPIVSPQDLLALSAKHIFLGHIHTPQPALDKLGIHYIGSMYAKAWGEVDTKGFYIVEGDAVKRVPYGTPKKYIVQTEEEARAHLENGDLVLVKNTSKVEHRPRMSAEEIYKARTLEDSFRAYAKAKGWDYTPTIKEKLAELSKARQS